MSFERAFASNVLNRDVVTGFLDLIDMAEEVPCLHENVLDLGRLGIPGRAQNISGYSAPTERHQDALPGR